MTTPPLTYLAALVDGGGTVPPELSAVRQLVERGHDVTVLAEDSMEHEVMATGATFRRWATAPNRADRSEENDPYRDWEVKSPMKLFERLLDAQFMGPAARYVADVQQAVAEHRPDVVLCSQFAFGAMVAAEAARIPFVVLMPNVYLLPAEGMPPLGMGFKPAKGAAGRLRDRVIGGFTTRVWDKKGLPRLNALRADLGLEPVPHFWDQVHQATRELVMTSADFDFPATLPAPARYVGPVLDDPTWVEPWSSPPGDEPLVLVALSSTFQDQGTTIQRIIEALASMPVRAVVTTGPALDAETLPAPANVSIVRVGAAQRSAEACRGRDHPWRSRHGDQGAGRRSADGRDVTRAGPGGERDPSDHTRGGCRGEEGRETREDRRGRAHDPRRPELSRERGASRRGRPS